MKKLFTCGELCRTIVIVLSFLTVYSCSTPRMATVVRETTHDTLYVSNVQYDSIYIDNWQLTDRSRDTIYLEKSHIEYRYKLLRDTVRVVQIDSIPVIREVEVIKTEKYIPKVYKWSFIICIILFCVFCVFCVLKIKF